MRMNTPVTTNEYVMPDGMMIVSQTDMGGRILSANEDFINVSGFAWNELQGEPHNLVRHPDMPPAAFADLWATLKAGEPWRGFVKNRRKNGDYYWVLANATPLKENGQVKGYVSIRLKPTDQEKRAAEALYRDIRDGKASNVAIVRGRVREKGLWASLKSIFTKTISRRVTVLLSFMVLALGSVGAGGVYAGKAIGDGLEALYVAAMKPSMDVGSINQLMGKNMELLYEAATHKKSGNEAGARQVIGQVRENAATITRIFDAYRQSVVVAEEQAAVDRFVAKRAAFVQDGVNPAIAMIEGGGEGDPGAHLIKIAGPLNSEAYGEALGIYRLLSARATRQEESARVLLTTISMAIVCATLFAAVIGFVMTHYVRAAVLGPIKQLDGIFEKIGAGNFEGRIEIERDDELGGVLRQIEALQTKLGFSRFEMADQQKKAEAEKRDGMMKLAADLESQVKGVVDSVSGAAGQMQASAQSMSSNAEQTSKQSSAVAAASEEASSNVQTVAAATEELSASVQEIGRQVAQSTTIATKAVDEAKRTDRTVAGLAESAQKIGEVVDLIRNIASQTNLLALNATIEAARAGDAGKGFAVVASEVKNLANQTAKATEDITNQIASIQDATTEAVSAIKGIGATISEISSISSAIAAAVEEQNSATQEIARNVQEAAKGTQEVSSNIGGVTEAARGTGEAAKDVLGAAQGLSKQAEMLRTTIQGFLKQIRAA